MVQQAFAVTLALLWGIDAERVALLVRDLSAARQEIRSAAVTELEALGPSILPQLPAESALEDAAARDTVTRLRKLLERRLAQEAAQPSRVTLSGPRPIGQILEEIERQTGNPIDWPGLAATESQRPFPAKWQRTPFWAAVNDVCQATDRQPRWDKNRGWLVGVPERHEREVTSAVSGPFRVAIRDLGWRPLPENPEKLLRVGLVLQAEPKLKPLFVAIRADDWQATLKKDRIPAWNKSAQYELPFYGDDREVRWMLDLMAPANLDPRGEMSIQGKCQVHLAAGTEPFVFKAAQFDSGGLIRRGDVTVRLKSARFEMDSRSMVVKLTVSYASGGPAFESHRIGAFARAGRLEGTDGKPVPLRDFNVLAETDGGIAVEYRFANLRDTADDYRIVYEAPMLLMDVPVEVELKVPAAPR